jgi:hypothetical protein
MTIDDESALKLGTELWDLVTATHDITPPSEVLLISLGRIAFKRSMELMREVQ